MGRKRQLLKAPGISASQALVGISGLVAESEFEPYAINCLPFPSGGQSPVLSPVRTPKSSRLRPRRHIRHGQHSQVRQTYAFPSYTRMLTVRLTLGLAELVSSHGLARRGDIDSGSTDCKGKQCRKHTYVLNI